MENRKTPIDLASDPFLCAELLASASRPPVSAAPAASQVGAWDKCLTCTDPGFDHDEFRWPEPAPAPEAR